MSKIIESLNTDNLIINKQLYKLKEDLASGKSNVDKSINDLQKNLLDTRSMLMQMINTNIQSIRKDINDTRMKSNANTSAIYPVDLIKNLIKDSISEHTSALEKKFDDLAKEQRAYLSQHIRKSTIQRVNSLQLDTNVILELIKQQGQETEKATANDVEQLKKQQAEFMSNIEQMVLSIKDKMGKI